MSSQSRTRVLLAVLSAALILVVGSTLTFASSPQAAGTVTPRAYIPLVKGRAGSQPPAGTPSPTPTTAASPTAQAPKWSTLWLNTNPINNTENASIAVDQSGGIHVAFTAYSPAGSTWPVYYAYCRSNCAAPASWSVVPVGDIGAWGGHARVDVTQAGQPRLMWFYQAGASGSGNYKYAQCDASCSSASGWHVVTLNSNGLGPLDQTRYFALDPQGRPRFLYTDTNSSHTGTFYAFCNSSCTSAGNWYHAKIAADYLYYDLSLAFNASGEARYGFYHSDSSGYHVGYGQCTGDCSLSTSWSLLALFDFGSGGDVSFAVSPSGYPRLAFYEGSHSPSKTYDNYLFYAWCDTADCLSTANWHNHSAGLAQNFGLQPDLKIDNQGYPRLAYHIDDINTSIDGLGYGICTANCETSSPAWAHEVVETSDDLDATDPVPPQSGCKSLWLHDGISPSLAVGAAGARIAYGTAHYQGVTCSIHNDIQLVRFALSGG